MKVEFVEIPLAELEMNDGQVMGLNKNPRQWTYEDVKRLQKSIEQSPEMLELRGLIVYKWINKYVVLGGNMRLTALRALGWKSAPCIVIPQDTSVRTLAEIIIKDNGTFGRWDTGMLKADWSDVPFAEWGIKVFDFPSEEPKKDAVETPVDNRKEWSIVLSADEFEFVNCALRDICDNKEVAFLTALGYYGD